MVIKMKKLKKLKVKIKTTPESFSTLALLKQRYPDIFTDDVEKMRPLKRTIYKDLQKELLGVVSQDSIQRAVKIYRGQKVYLEKLITPDAEEVNLQGEYHRWIREGYAKSVELELRKLEAEGLDCFPMESFPPERWDSFEDRPPKIKIPPPVKKVEKPVEKLVKKAENKPNKKTNPIEKTSKNVVEEAKPARAKMGKPKSNVAIHNKLNRQIVDKPSTASVIQKFNADKPRLSLRRKPKKSK